MNSQTTHATKKGQVEHNWYVIDAADQVLGKVATTAAKLLMGKNKAYWTSNLDCGDNVIIINTRGIELTGNKEKKKIYQKHTGYLGGLKTMTYEQMKAKNPTKAIEIAIKGMLPKNKMGSEMFRKLFVYADAEHKHSAQQPVAVNIS